LWIDNTIHEGEKLVRFTARFTGILFAVLACLGLGIGAANAQATAESIGTQSHSYRQAQSDDLGVLCTTYHIKQNGYVFQWPSGPIIGRVYAGQQVYALGPDQSGTWIEIFLPPHRTSWVPAYNVSIRQGTCR
jgi:hypothetical protein